MTRTFAMVYWSPEEDSCRSIYDRMTVASAISFRAQNPTADLVVICLFGSLCPVDRHKLTTIGVHVMDWSGTTERSTYNKTMALEMLTRSFYDQVCLFDADLIWTGPADDIWNLSPECPVLAVHYPLYPMQRSGINTCLTLVRSHEAAYVLLRTRDQLDQQDASLDPKALGLVRDAPRIVDESIVDHVILHGSMSVGYLTPEWAMDPASWWPTSASPKRRRGFFCEWPEPLRFNPEAKIDRMFWVGYYPRAFHFSGRRERFLDDPRSTRYLASCLAKILADRERTLPPSL
jgi:hypothetical protein